MILFKKKLHKANANILRIFCVSIIIMLLSGCATNVKLKTHIIKSNEIPYTFDNYTIIFISDIHINDLLKEKYFLKVAKIIEQNSPDLILLGGDYIDANTSDIDKAFELLNRLTAVKTIAVLGNHDNWISKNKVMNQLKKLNIAILENSRLLIKEDNQSIIIAGLADNYSDEIKIEPALSGIKKEDFCILLSHSPEPYKSIKDDARVDLMLSGHTHGGQITFFGLVAPILPLNDKTYWRGVYKSKNNQLIITNGIGVYKFAVRIFACPRIEKIVLKRVK